MHDALAFAPKTHSKPTSSPKSPDPNGLPACSPHCELDLLGDGGLCGRLRPLIPRQELVLLIFQIQLLNIGPER